MGIDESINGTNGTTHRDSTADVAAKTTRVALITGAAQGIGREIALRLARDGLDIALNDIPSNLANLEAVQEKIQTGTKQRCVLFPGDVSKEEDVIGMVEGAVRELGGVDVMIANAGIAVVTPLVELSVEEFDRTMSINVRGVMMCYKYAAIQMIKQGRGGRIIGASSISGKNGSPYLSAYGASKFAVRGLTQCAALELGKHGITVNAYAPGPILTSMMEEFDERVAQVEATSNRQKGDFLQEMADRAALGRSGTPADVASLVSYLASEESRFITGQSIIVDGGLAFD